MSALATCLAEWPSQPWVTFGRGGLQGVFLFSISQSLNSTFDRRAGMSRSMMSPSRRTATGPPTMASRERCPMQDPPGVPGNRPCVTKATDLSRPMSTLRYDDKSRGEFHSRCWQWPPTGSPGLGLYNPSTQAMPDGCNIAVHLGSGLCFLNGPFSSPQKSTFVHRKAY